MLKKLLIVLFCCAAISRSLSAEVLLEAGSPPPPLKLGNFDLNQTSGKVTALVFFASWSKPCQEEIIFIDRLAGRYREAGLKVIAVSFDRKQAELDSFVKANQIDFPVYRDKKLATLKDYRIVILPTLVLINREGKVTGVYVDFDENVSQAVEAEIAKLLAPHS